MSSGRPLIKIIFQNFINSFKPRKWRGTLVGEDYYGNKFYEIKPDEGNTQRQQRWFEPPEKENHEQEMAAEWEAWLRGRRKIPPTREELLKNLAIIQMKKKNAALLEDKFQKPQDHAALKRGDVGKTAFPSYGKEYEIQPGREPGARD